MHVAVLSDVWEIRNEERCGPMMCAVGFFALFYDLTSNFSRHRHGHGPLPPVFRRLVCRLFLEMCDLREGNKVGRCGDSTPQDVGSDKWCDGGSYQIFCDISVP